MATCWTWFTFRFEELKRITEDVQFPVDRRDLDVDRVSSHRVRRQRRQGALVGRRPRLRRRLQLQGFYRVFRLPSFYFYSDDFFSSDSTRISTVPFRPAQSHVT